MILVPADDLNIRPIFRDLVLPGYSLSLHATRYLRPSYAEFFIKMLYLQMLP